MRYMLLCCFDEARWAEMPEAEKGRLMEAYGAFVQGIVRSGHYRAGAQLHPTATATTLRGANGTVVTTDGPFAETTEQLGGYHLIECRDLDEALSIARRNPALLAGGAIEVRPVMPAG